MYLKKLKDLRIDNDLYQKEVASILKITRQQYGLYESGKRDIPIDLLIKLADFYGTSVDYLLYRTDEIKPYPKSKLSKKSLKNIINV